MNTLQTLEMALEVLEHKGNIYHIDCPVNAATTALRQQIELEKKAEKQEIPYVLVERDSSGKTVVSAMPSKQPADEPVGEVVEIDLGDDEDGPHAWVQLYNDVELGAVFYTRPQPVAWVGLTDEDRRAAFESLPDMLDGFLKKWGWLHFSKAIEAKLKEKNT